MEDKSKKTDPHDGTEKYDALKIYTTATEAERALLNRIAETDIPSLCYAYKSRVKSESALLEKVQRKKNSEQEKKPNYNLLEITDVIGIRFVTLFRSNMPDVVHEVLKLIRHKIDLSPNPFKKDSVEEIKVYHVPHIEDPIIPEIRKHVEKYDLKDIFATYPKGEYSSIHIVARLEYKIKDFLKHNGDDSFFIPIEIQIRTVFEDAWGEIDHKYGYVIREGKSENKPVNNPESIHAHLKVLKKFVDASSQYADQISKEASTPSFRTHNSGTLISVGNDESILDRFRELNIDEDKILRYAELRIEREDRVHNDKRESLPSLAENFNNLSQTQISDDGSPFSEGGKVFYFYCRMNEAFCLLSTKTAEHIKLSITIYKELKTTYNEYPILHHRIGQAYGRLGDHQKAILHLKDCLSMTAKAKKLNIVGSDSIPEVDFKHLNEHTPILLGYNYWAEQHYNQSLSKDEKIKILEEACKTTEISTISSETDQKRVSNNLLYYYLDLRDLHEKPETDVDDKISELLAKIEEGLSTDDNDDLDLLDTLAKAHHSIGNDDKAKDYCNKIIKLSLEKAPAETDADIVLEIAQEAWALTHKLNGRSEK